MEYNILVNKQGSAVSSGININNNISNEHIVMNGNSKQELISNSNKNWQWNFNWYLKIALLEESVALDFLYFLNISYIFSYLSKIYNFISFTNYATINSSGYSIYLWFSVDRFAPLYITYVWPVCPNEWIWN